MCTVLSHQNIKLDLAIKYENKFKKPIKNIKGTKCHM